MQMAFPLMACAALALVAGCSSEPDFDARFEQRAQELAAEARKIEAESSAQLAQAREAEQAAAEATGEASVAGASAK